MKRVKVAVNGRQNANRRALIVHQQPKGDRPIVTGWKGIAAYIGWSISTVRRFAAIENLPIKRKGGIVYAFKADLDDWLGAGSAE